MLRTIAKSRILLGARWGSSSTNGQAMLRNRGRALSLVRHAPRRGLATSASRPDVGGATKPQGEAMGAELMDSDAGGGEITSQDLLERYRGLVALGRVKWDDEQVRTIMKVSPLRPELFDLKCYAHRCIFKLTTSSDTSSPHCKTIPPRSTFSRNSTRRPQPSLSVHSCWRRTKDGGMQKAEPR